MQQALQVTTQDLSDLVTRIKIQNNVFFCYLRAPQIIRCLETFYAKQPCRLSDAFKIVRLNSYTIFYFAGFKNAALVSNYARFSGPRRPLCTLADFSRVLAFQKHPQLRK
jgi:hypothetical protein